MSTGSDEAALGLETYSPITVDHEVDHRQLAVSRLPGHLRNKTRFRALTRALAGGVQAFEDVVWGVLEGTILPSAVGAALERWGLLLDEPRGSLSSDEDYRPIIEARIRANRSNGDVDSLIEVLRTACAPVVCIEHITLYPAGFKIQVTRQGFMGPARRLRVRRIMALCKPGGRDGRFVEAVEGGFGPAASCGSYTFTGPLAREI